MEQFFFVRLLFAHPGILPFQTKPCSWKKSWMERDTEFRTRMTAPKVWRGLPSTGLT